MFPSSRNMCWAGSKSSPEQGELGVGRASLTVEITSLTRCGHSQQGHVQWCSLGKTFLIKNVEKGLLFFFFFWYVLITCCLWSTSREQELFYLSVPSRCALKRNGQLWNCDSCSLEVGVKDVLRRVYGGMNNWEWSLPSWYLSPPSFHGGKLFRLCMGGSGMLGLPCLSTRALH